MICPPVGLVAPDHDQILPLDPGHLMAIKPSNHPARDPSPGTQHQHCKPNGDSNVDDYDERS